jgi:hypothetical protein
MRSGMLHLPFDKSRHKLIHRNAITFAMLRKPLVSLSRQANRYHASTLYTFCRIAFTAPYAIRPNAKKVAFAVERCRCSAKLFGNLRKRVPIGKHLFDYCDFIICVSWLATHVSTFTPKGLPSLKTLLSNDRDHPSPKWPSFEYEHGFRRKSLQSSLYRQNFNSYGSNSAALAKGRYCGSGGFGGSMGTM